MSADEGLGTVFGLPVTAIVIPFTHFCSCCGQEVREGGSITMTPENKDEVLAILRERGQDRGVW